MRGLLWLFAFVLFLVQVRARNRTKPAILEEGSIPGPKYFHSHIAVVGGGPAGIHMAYLLKEKGFTNVLVLERTDRIGGKSRSIPYRGAPHEMGTMYTAPDYEDNILELVRKFVPGDLTPFPPPSIWKGNYSDPTPVAFQQYLGRYMLNYYQTRNVTLASLKLMKAVHKYVAIHKSLFGDYDHELMPKPTPQVMKKIRGTFADFLARNNISELTLLFMATHTIQGYGHLDELAALYGLIWNTPKMMQAVTARILGQDSKAGVYMLKNGFQNLWETIAKKSGLKIVFNADVIKVERSYSDDSDTPSVLKYKDHSNGKIFQKRFDFIVWTPCMKDSLSKFRQVSKWEHDLFGRTSSTYFTTAIVNSVGERRATTPIDYWYDRIVSKEEHVVWAQRESYAVLNGYSGAKYQKSEYPTGSDNLKMRTTVMYMMGHQPIYPSKPRDKNRLMQSIEKASVGIGAKMVQVRNMTTWKYFPRYNSTDIEEGILWEILAYQGKRKMWYLGSSVIFESVKSVVEYNKMVVKYMKEPSSCSQSAQDLSRMALQYSAVAFLLQYYQELVGISLW